MKLAKNLKRKWGKAGCLLRVLKISDTFLRNVEGYTHVQTVCMLRAMHTLGKELRRSQGPSAG